MNGITRGRSGVVAGTRVQGMEDKQENEIHHSDLTSVLRVPLKVCIVSSSKRQPLSHITLEESRSKDGVEDSLTEPATKISAAESAL